jgi:hypothetical protein
MKLIPATAMSLAALALLTACGQKTNGAAASGNAAASGGDAAAPAAASGPDTEIKISDIPTPRAGLWKHLEVVDGKSETRTLCHKGSLPEMPKKPRDCQEFTLKKTFLGGYKMDMKCVSPESTIEAHATITGDFQSHVVGDSTMTMTGKGIPPQMIKTHIEDTWVGPCAPGQETEEGN